jgi:ubiquinone/menaquinone biosynthesis C-methylase UbiE
MRQAHRLSVPRQASWLAICALLIAALPAELEAQRRSRDSWQRVPDVIAALAIGAGSRVADVGAGSGYFTEHLARAVGADGRVYAVEISERSLSQLRRLAEDGDFDNIEVVRGAVDDPRLPERSLNAVLVVDAYHEMTEYEAMLSGMYRALRPGGRLVILDLVPADPSQSRDRQTRSHELSIDIVEEELREAGFEVLERDPEFTQSGRNHGQWLLVARR